MKLEPLTEEPKFEDIVSGRYFPVSKTHQKYYLEVRWTNTWYTVAELKETDRSAPLKIAEFEKNRKQFSREQMIEMAEPLRRQVKMPHKVAAIVDAKDGRYEAVWCHSWEPFSGEKLERTYLEEEIIGEDLDNEDVLASSDEEGTGKSNRKGAKNSGNDAPSSDDSEEEKEEENDADFKWKVSRFLGGRWMNGRYIASYEWFPTWMTQAEILPHDPEAKAAIEEFENRRKSGLLATERWEAQIADTKRRETRMMHADGTSDHLFRVARVVARRDADNQPPVFKVIWCNSEYIYWPSPKGGM